MLLRHQLASSTTALDAPRSLKFKTSCPPHIGGTFDVHTIYLKNMRFIFETNFIYRTQFLCLRLRSFFCAHWLEIIYSDSQKVSRVSIAGLDFACQGSVCLVQILLSKKLTRTKANSNANSFSLFTLPALVKRITVIRGRMPLQSLKVKAVLSRAKLSKLLSLQCKTVPKMLNNIDTDTFSQHQILLIPIPVLFSVPNFSDTGSETYFRY